MKIVEKSMVIFLTIFLIIIHNVEAIAEETKELTVNERMIRLETKVDEGFKRIEEKFDAMNQRMEEGFKAVNQRIDDLREVTYVILTGIITLFAGIIGLIGFVIWDRRTTLAPVVRELKEVAKQEELILEALKLYGRTAPKLAEAIKTVGLI